MIARGMGRRESGKRDWIPPPAFDLPPSLEHAGDRYWGLFIAFDTHSYVSKHEIRELNGTDLEKACQKWAV